MLIYPQNLLRSLVRESSRLLAFLSMPRNPALLGKVAISGMVLAFTFWSLLACDNSSRQGREVRSKHRRVELFAQTLGPGLVANGCKITPEVLASLKKDSEPCSIVEFCRLVGYNDAFDNFRPEPGVFVGVKPIPWFSPEAKSNGYAEVLYLYSMDSSDGRRTEIEEYFLILTTDMEQS